MSARGARLWDVLGRLRISVTVGGTRRHLPPAVQAADERLFLKLARSHSPVLDATLPRLSRAANHSRLWIGIAAVLATFGGRKGRRAATRGLRAIALTSAIVNGPIKWIARRHRPETESLPVMRRLLRVPGSSSFPSGHTASAAAFATAAGMEFPVTAAPLGVIAAGVGISRIFTGAHFPSDVVAGAALGASAAVVSRTLSAARDRWVPASADLPDGRRLDLGTGAGVVVVVNPSAGSVLARDPIVALKDAFPAATILESDGDMDSALRAACDRDTVAIVVAGGDGSVNAAATIAQECGVPLGVVPAGTFNHLAGDLGIQDVAASIEALRNGHVTQIDTGAIAGKPFLNTASFAAYPEFVDERERLESTIGKWPAALIAIVRVLRGPPPVRVEIDGKRMDVWAIFIGNGRYEPAGIVPRRRASLAGDDLDVRVLRASRRYSRLRALLVNGPRFGHARSGFESWRTDRIEVRSLDGPLRLARDGEAFDGPDHFTIEKAPKPLEVFVPSDSRGSDKRGSEKRGSEKRGSGEPSS